jgi:CRP/FNR family transcriptional regulator/CRP/FNR family cyclic AMP-dependent transcriptional regulator
MEKVTLLAQVPLFASLTTEQLAEIADRLIMRNYQRGATIIRQDEPGSMLYIIVNGHVKITSVSSEGEELILALLTDNDFFGELSLLDGQPHSASATAMETTQVMTLNRDEFLEVIAKNPEMVNNILVVLSNRLRRTNTMFEDAVFLQLPARLSKRLLELGEQHGLKTDSGLEIELRLTQQDLANFLGASRVAINRLLRQLQDSGLISINRKHITILQPGELENNI